jgi:hypothetical protein
MVVEVVVESLSKLALATKELEQGLSSERVLVDELCYSMEYSESFEGTS